MYTVVNKKSTMISEVFLMRIRSILDTTWAWYGVWPVGCGLTFGGRPGPTTPQPGLPGSLGTGNGGNALLQFSPGTGTWNRTFLHPICGCGLVQWGAGGCGLRGGGVEDIRYGDLSAGCGGDDGRLNKAAFFDGVGE